MDGCKCINRHTVVKCQGPTWTVTATVIPCNITIASSDKGEETLHLHFDWLHYYIFLGDHTWTHTTRFTNMRQRHTTRKHLAKMHNMTSSAKNSCVCKYYQDSQIHELAANSEKDSRRVSWGFYSAENRHHGCCKILWLIKLAVYSPLCLYIYTWIFLHIFFQPPVKKDFHAH